MAHCECVECYCLKGSTALSGVPSLHLGAGGYQGSSPALFPSLCSFLGTTQIPGTNLTQNLCAVFPQTADFSVVNVVWFLCINVCIFLVGHHILQ